MPLYEIIDNKRVIGGGGGSRTRRKHIRPADSKEFRTIEKLIFAAL
jgi:hypothetical protein